MVPLSMAEVSAASFVFDGSKYTSDANGAANLNKVFKKYKEKGVFKGDGNCCGFANAVGDMIAKSRKSYYWTGKRLTRPILKNIVWERKLGRILEFHRLQMIEEGNAKDIQLYLLK